MSDRYNFIHHSGYTGIVTIRPPQFEANSFVDFQLGRSSQICGCCGSIVVNSFDNFNGDLGEVNKGVTVAYEDKPTKLESNDEYKIESVKIGDTYINFMLRQIP